MTLDNIPQQDLDNLVIAETDIMAVSINNQGREGQIQFLLDQGWTEKSILHALSMWGRLENQE